MTGHPGHHHRTPGPALTWRKDTAGEACDLSGHFWATLRSHRGGGRTIWSWMIIGYENQVLAAGQTGDQSAAKRLAEEWDRWVRADDAALDATSNPPAIADDCQTYEPAWPHDR